MTDDIKRDETGDDAVATFVGIGILGLAVYGLFKLASKHVQIVPSIEQAHEDDLLRQFYEEEYS